MNQPATIWVRFVTRCGVGDRDFEIGQLYELPILLATRLVADGHCTIYEADLNAVPGQTKEFKGGVTPEQFAGPAPDVFKPGPRDDFLNLTQAAKRLAMPTGKVRDLIIAEVLIGKKIDGVPPAWLIRKDSIEAYAGEHGIDGESEAGEIVSGEKPEKKVRGGRRSSASKRKAVK